MIYIFRPKLDGFRKGSHGVEVHLNPSRKNEKSVIGFNRIYLPSSLLRHWQVFEAFIMKLAEIEVSTFPSMTKDQLVDAQNEGGREKYSGRNCVASVKILKIVLMSNLSDSFIQRARRTCAY